MRKFQSKSIQTRLTRLMVLVVMGTFLVIGVVAMFVIRSGARTTLSQEHQAELAEITREVDAYLQGIADNVRHLSTSAAARSFAGETITVASTQLEDAQRRLTGEFISLAQSHPREYLEIRYVTRSGSVWTKVSNFEGIEADTSVYLNQLSGDEALTASLRELPNTVVLSSIIFQRDQSGQQITPPRPMLRFSAPVASPTDNTNIPGAIQVDVDAERLLSIVNSAPVNLSMSGRRMLLVNNLGQILADSAEPDNSYPRRGVPSESSSFSIRFPDLDQLLRNQTGDFIAVDVRDEIASGSRVSIGNLPHMPWTLLLVDNTAQALGSLEASSVGVLVLSLGIGAVISVLIRLALTRMLSPLTAATTLAQKLATEAEVTPLPVPVQTDDEFGQLVTAFDQISQRMQTLSTDLETQMGRYTRNLEIAALIGRETATLYDIDALLNRAINLIVEQFQYYHAQVFLTDDVNQYAVLFYSYGETGRQMLERKHKIEVGSESVIGRVTSTGKAVVVNDTTHAETGAHRFNPLLPETRAELAVPLMIRQQVIGALDIQSKQPNAFRDEELQTFQLLADQIAIAIYNARLLQESQSRVEQIDTLNRQLTRVAWQDVETRVGLENAYRYDLFRIEAGDTSDRDVPGRITAPIIIRGEVIGTLAAEPQEGVTFSEGDHAILRAVADRVALAIENARLFQETQASLAQTSILYQISRFLNEADTLEDIVQAIIISVMPDAISGQIGVFDDFKPGESPEWMEISVDWSMGLREDEAVQLQGIQLYLPDHPLLHNMHPDQVALVNDTQRDERLDDKLRAFFNQLGARSAVLVPFSVRGEWRGIILIEFPEVREFGEREGRIYSTLIDQVGVAIDNRLLLRQTEFALSQIERLYSASRIINTAQNTVDLVQAAVSTTSSTALDFELGVFEGELDATGWPTRLRLVARSEHQTTVLAENTVYPVQIPAESPLRYREPQVLIDHNPDDADAPTLIQYLRAHGNRFGVAFPLFSASQPIALFTITSREAYELSAEDYEVYRALTGQMSTVLQNRRLLEQTAEVLDETRRLYAASRAITSAQDFGSVYQAAAEHLGGTEGEVSRVLLLLAGPTPTRDATYFEYHYVWTRDGEGGGNLLLGTRLSSDSVPFAHIIEQAGGAVHFANLARDLENQPLLLSLFEEAGAASAVISPIQTGRKWLGVLICESDHHNVFDEQYVRFTQAIADQVAIAIDNRQLFEEAQAEAKRALALAEASQLATRMGGAFEESLAEVFARVAEPAQYDRWLLMLLDDEGNRLELVTANMPDAVPDSFDLTTKSSHSIIDAVRLNRTIVINDTHNYPAFATSQPQLVRGVGRHIVTPIRSGEQVVGALLVGRPLEGANLDERDEQLITTLAAQVAIAVENRRLFVEAESERQTLRSTLETMPAGVLVLNAETYKPLQYNEQAVYLLGREIDPNTPFNPVDYNIYRTGTNVHYPPDELPIFAVLGESGQSQVDDVAIIHEDGTQTDLLVNAAPIYDIRGNVTAIVAAFTDISNLRSLENTLQDNLRDTIQLYEATRALAEVDEESAILDLVIEKLAVLNPAEAYVLLLDETYGVRVVRTLNSDTKIFPLPDDLLNAQNPLVVTDARVRYALPDDVRDQLLAQGVVAVASLPLRARSRRDVPLGWLVLTFDEPRLMSPEEERFINTISDGASIALDNRYLFRSTETALKETAALYDATTSISRARDLSELAQALQAALESIYPDMYAAYLLPVGAVEDTKEMFNVSLDAEPADFRALLLQHHETLVDNIYIDDLHARLDPTDFERDLIAMGNVRSLAIVNLGIKGAAKGYLVIAYHQPHRFTDSEARYLSTVADSASVVIDNVLLFEQIQSTLDETSMLYQASRALSDATTPQDILNVVVNHLVDHSTTLVFLAQLRAADWNTPGAYIHIAASWQRDIENDLGLTGVALTAEQFPAWRQLASQGILMLSDVLNADSLSEDERIGLDSLNLRSLAVIPLRAGRRSIGSILLGSNETRNYTERDLRVFQSFAEQASLKMEAANLLQQMERRARQLATSAEVARSASTILDLNVLLPRLVDLICDAFQYDHVQIFLMDGDDEYAELRASTGEAGRQLLSIKHKLQKGSASVIGQVTATGTPAIALDTADATVIHRPNPYLPNTRSEMAVPLIIKSRVVGALDVQSNQPNAFDDDDVAVLTTLAAQISVAIDNARLFEQSRRRASEMSFLFSVTTAAASSDTLQNALQNVATELLGSMEAISVRIYLPEERATQDGSETVLLPVALAGTDQPLSELPEIELSSSAENLIANAAQTRRSLIIGNLSTESHYQPVVESARSAVIVPLTSGSQFIGLVTMESNQINAYDNETLTLLLTLSGTLSAIIQSQQLLEQVQRQNEELRTLDRLKSDFLANMSHELRTPLNSIIGFSRVILKGIDGPLTEMQEQDLTTIYNSGQHLLNLINDILDQAKISANKLDLQCDYFEMKQVIDAVRSIGIGLVKDKPIDILVDVASGLPKAYGDEFRTRQILLNLVSNASKFTKEGSITIKVYPELDEETGKQMLRVDVTDTGIGIAEKDIPLLFEAFRQVDSSLTRTVGGTGLGLPIAKSLCEMQGGHMFVTSKVNVGSTFSITVPVEPVTVEEKKGSTGQLNGTGSLAASGSSAPEPKDDNAHTRKTVEHPMVQMPMTVKRQILIIEDNPDMVDQIRRALQREGFDVFAATIPLEAEAMASGLHPTIIIMDVNFANGQGWDILAKLKSRDDTCDIPVIVVTLNTESEKVINAGAFRYIQRPIIPEVLVQAVQDAERESHIDRILIIDDQPESVRLLQELLQEHGDYRVFSATTGQDGIALVARRRPNLIILDLRMPEMDGFAVVEELRNNPETATIPILVVTGETLTAEERERLRNLHVLYKTDISLQQYLDFIEGVKTHLNKQSGD